jgi:uncharacterized protein YfiM (DUF2279 family)
MLTLSFTPGQRADPVFGVDKIQHFAMGMFVQGLGYGAVRMAGGNNMTALAVASTGSASVAVAKERWDARGNGVASRRDIAWTIAGAGAMSIGLAQVR